MQTSPLLIATQAPVPGFTQAMAGQACGIVLQPT
jgi:hypothetical protein